MTAIRDYLRQIAGYLILSVLVENLVAKKEYGPYIRLFLNLLLVLLFVRFCPFQMSGLVRLG